MFRAVPLRWMALCLCPMLVEAVLQVGVPVAGVVVSKLLVPMVSVWWLVTTDQRVRSGRFAMGLALRRTLALRNTLILVALMSACVFVLQVLLAWGLAGGPAARLLLTADPGVGQAFSRAQVACVLGSGTIPAMLLFFTVPRMVLDGMPAGMALGENLRLLRTGWRPLTVSLLVSCALVVGFVYQPWLLLLVLPLGYVGYWAYRDTFDPPQHA
ncbi:hypothetical protein [Pseudoxanthomonas sp. JBR18]|uniref:hypothetical protein n=1 Tax=Pseudoxanthomonas sp. JBR18 TaxID=2969308 RepID=UPI0023060036|nr:hypothetical protein [Pseudoxanthomonas sp. JBR18]WCE05086.1 hypothetical protein PJ250_03650 [Pseudoxanthomonas sp. JBR18]